MHAKGSVQRDLINKFAELFDRVGYIHRYTCLDRYLRQPDSTTVHQNGTSLTLRRRGPQPVEGLFGHIRDTPPPLRAQLDSAVPAGDGDDDILLAAKFQQFLKPGAGAVFAAVMRTGPECGAVRPHEMGGAFQRRGCGDVCDDAGGVIGVVKTGCIPDELGRVERAGRGDSDTCHFRKWQGASMCKTDDQSECERACDGVTRVITCGRFLELSLCFLSLLSD